MIYRIILPIYYWLLVIIGTVLLYNLTRCVAILYIRIGQSFPIIIIVITYEYSRDIIGIYNTTTIIRKRTSIILLLLSYHQVI